MVRHRRGRPCARVPTHRDWDRRGSGGRRRRRRRRRGCQSIKLCLHGLLGELHVVQLLENLWKYGLGGHGGQVITLEAHVYVASICALPIYKYM